MILSRTIKIQLALFTAISVIAGFIMVFRYINAPAMFFGVGHYTVMLELPRAGGLYPNANVSYRGTEVGQVRNVALTDYGVRAELSLKSGITIPSHLRAEVHSQSAIGEQYISLLPLDANSSPLKDGDVIRAAQVSLPPDVDSLLDAVNRGLKAIPHDNLKTAIDESYTAVGGLGPELSRLVLGGTQLAIDADHNLDPLITVIDQSKPILDSQTDSAGAIQGWAAHLATITNQLRSSDTAVAGILQNGGSAFDQSRQLVERLQPTLPLLLANLVSVGEVALRYQPALEQLLVLLPQAVASVQGIEVANKNTKQAYQGIYLDFHLNVNLPPPCTTGFLPPQQQRSPSLVDAPDRAPGDLYCRIPQDSVFQTRGARNYPCLTVPGKRTPTVKMCESNEQYVPLNDGFNWKGDPNATYSGQDIPQLPPGSGPVPAPPPLPPGMPSPPAPPPAAPTPPPIAAAQYDPATGAYIGPDGHLYTQSDLSQAGGGNHTWQSLLMPGQS
jgi:phospholipid/cholesterol/gamma-HCH transport system substrate-binding protein